MKLKEGLILREIAGETVVLPSGDDLDLSVMITLNGTATFLWKLLEQETEPSALVDALLKEYDVDQETAETAVSNFIGKLNQHGFLE